MFIRQIKSEDAEQLLHLIQAVETSSPYMLMEAGERKTTVEQQRRVIEQNTEQANSTILVAECEGLLVGYLMAIGGRAKRNKHSTYLVVGIREEYRGQGIGSALFQAIEEWAITNAVTRLELTVITKNEAAIALYRKKGFTIEGTKKNSLFINGAYSDEYYMSKLYE